MDTKNNPLDHVLDLVNNLKEVADKASTTSAKSSDNAPDAAKALGALMESLKKDAKKFNGKNIAVMDLSGINMPKELHDKATMKQYIEAYEQNKLMSSAGLILVQGMRAIVNDMERKKHKDQPTEYWRMRLMAVVDAAHAVLPDSDD